MASSAAWQKAGFSPDDAHRWITTGFTLQEATASGRPVPPGTVPVGNDWPAPGPWTPDELEDLDEEVLREIMETDLATSPSADRPLAAQTLELQGANHPRANLEWTWGRSET